MNVLYRVLDILINRLKSRFLEMNEIVPNFSVLQLATLHNLWRRFIGKFADLNKKDISASFSKEILSFRDTPATKATAERSFSKLKPIKTYLRNSMGQLWMSFFALKEGPSLSSLSLDSAV